MIRPTVALVSAADSEHFHLLKGLILSFRDLEPNRDIALCVIDLGLESYQRDWIAAHVDRMAAGRWDIDFPGNAELPRHMQSLTCRPFLPGYFPDYSTYLWLDADTWIQTASALDLFLEAARDGHMGLTPEIDRAYRCHYDQGVARRWMHRCYRDAFGDEVADCLWWMPVLNAGAFSLEAGSPSWAAWELRLRQALERTHEFVDQTALNLAIYAEEITAHFLPATANWLCNFAAPLYDPPTGDLLDPNLPHRKLGILHLAGPRPKNGPVELPTTSGGTVCRWLKFNGGEY